MTRPNSRLMASVRERDVELLVIEELWGNHEFRSWLVESLGADPDGTFRGAWHAVSDRGSGESDLEIGVERPDGSRQLLLIENAMEQPPSRTELERYHGRGRTATAGEYDAFSVRLLAPDALLSAIDADAPLDGTLSYERIRDRIGRPGTPRSDFKAGVLSSAIGQAQSDRE